MLVLLQLLLLRLLLHLLLLLLPLFLLLILILTTGVALTFEKLRIENAQHGKNCVSSPAPKATISTDLPKIDKLENTNV